ncbi:MAG: hypothetical protein NXI10_01285 [bacterium]|nr:hypothetical protein [bacterium]
MKKQTFGFNLVNIQTEQFALFEENIGTKQSYDYSINTEIEIGSSTAEKGVQLIIGITLQQKNKPHIKIEVACSFIIEDATWDSFCEEREIVFPKAFMQHLAKISIGTVRGILHARTRNTVFSEFMLPLLNVNDIVSEDIRLSLDED